MTVSVSDSLVWDHGITGLSGAHAQIRENCFHHVRGPGRGFAGARALPPPLSSSTMVWISGWWTWSGSATGSSSTASPRKIRIGTGCVVEKRMRPVAPTISLYSSSTSAV